MDLTPTIACVLKSGGTYTSEWPQRLHRSIQKHLNTPFNFVCLSDIQVPSITTIPLTQGWRGWWSKIELFRPNLFHGPVLYLDLDVLVIGDITPLLSCCTSFTMVREKKHNDYFSSSCMAWTGDYSFIYDEFKRDPEAYMLQYKRFPRIGDQAFISHMLVTSQKTPRTFLQALGYDAIASYKRHNCQNAPPSKACAVDFHGKPKPHQLKSGWVCELWTETKQNKKVIAQKWRPRA